MIPDLNPEFEPFVNCPQDERDMRAKEVISNSRGYIVLFVDENGEAGCYRDLTKAGTAERLGLITFGRVTMDGMESNLFNGAKEV